MVIERGVIAHRARSQDLLRDQAMLGRYVGLNLDKTGSVDLDAPKGDNAPET